MPPVFYENGEKWCHWDNYGGFRYRCFLKDRNPERLAILLWGWSWLRSCSASCKQAALPPGGQKGKPGRKRGSGECRQRERP